MLGSYAEYDAVPGNSQQVGAVSGAARRGCTPMPPGTPTRIRCSAPPRWPAILAAKAAMEAHGVPGTLKLFGEPAEKVCGSKPIHAAKGYYDGLDAASSSIRWPSNTVTGETQCGAYWSAVFTFEARRAGALGRPGADADRRRRTPPPAAPARSTRSA